MRDGDRVQDAQGRRGTVVQVRVHTFSGHAWASPGQKEPLARVKWRGGRTITYSLLSELQEAK